MKISSQSPVRATTAPRAAGRSAPAGKAGPAGQAAAAVPTTSLMGIPTEELTPKVRVAIETLMNEVERLRRDRDEVKHQNSHLEKLADEDSLLPVINRRAFVRELSRAMSFAQRYTQPSSLAFFDVNNMKTINDELGHAAGDAALMHVAEMLLEHVRHSDVVGRLGGDEFGVVLAQADEDAALRKTEELAAAINDQPAIWNGKEIKVAVAHGQYTFSGKEEPSQALLVADQAMYRHKRAAGAGR